MISRSKAGHRTVRVPGCWCIMIGIKISYPFGAAVFCLLRRSAKKHKRSECNGITKSGYVPESAIVSNNIIFIAWSANRYAGILPVVCVIGKSVVYGCYQVTKSKVDQTYRKAEEGA